MPYVYPDNELGFAENFLSMMFKMAEPHYDADPVLARALEVLFILHVDHEQNCSANAMRAIGSSKVDPYSAMAGAAAALYGPLHGGANEAVLRMLAQIGDVKNVPEFVKRVKDGEGRLMGFGHRVYKNYDPRAKIIKEAADSVFEVTGRNPLLDIALELEKIALEDEYFVSRKLYPNVDFYSGLIYQALGLPTAMFPVLFAIPRTAGWLAQWLEGIADPEQKIARPRQLYVGAGERDYVPVVDRGAGRKDLVAAYVDGRGDGNGRPRQRGLPRSGAAVCDSCRCSPSLLAAAAVAAPPDPKQFMKVDARHKIVDVTLIAGYDGTNNGFNFDGYAGYLMWTVPRGWRIRVTCKNEGGLRHSCAVVKNAAATKAAFTRRRRRRTRSRGSGTARRRASSSRRRRPASTASRASSRVMRQRRCTTSSGSSPRASRAITDLRR